MKTWKIEATTVDGVALEGSTVRFNGRMGVTDGPKLEGYENSEVHMPYETAVKLAGFLNQLIADVKKRDMG